MKVRTQKTKVVYLSAALCSYKSDLAAAVKYLPKWVLPKNCPLLKLKSEFDAHSFNLIISLMLIRHSKIQYTSTKCKCTEVTG